MTALNLIKNQPKKTKHGNHQQYQREICLGLYISTNGGTAYTLVGSATSATLSINNDTLDVTQRRAHLATESSCTDCRQQLSQLKALSNMMTPKAASSSAQ